MIRRQGPGGEWGRWGGGDREGANGEGETERR